MRVNVRVTGTERVSRKLLRFENRVGDMRPALEDVADVFLKANQQIFRRNGAYGENPRWPALQPATIAEKRRKRMPVRVMRRTRALETSLTSKADGDHIRKVTRNSVEVGTSNELADYHHQSRGSRKTKVPQRRLVSISKQDRAESIRIIQRFLVEDRKR